MLRASSGSPTRARNGHRVLAVVRGSGGQPGRRLQRPDRAQRPVPAARHPPGAGRPPASRRRRRRGRGARHRHDGSATRSRRRRCSRRYGQDRPTGAPLWLGSLKSNIGHTQAAAGVGGVIKMVMALRHGVLPKTLHVDAAVAARRLVGRRGRAADRGRQPWPRGERVRGAPAVSSFGISGTNAHVILEEAPAARRAEPPAPSRRPAATRSPRARPLAARGDAAAARRRPTRAARQASTRARRAVGSGRRRRHRLARPARTRFEHRARVRRAATATSCSPALRGARRAASRRAERRPTGAPVPGKTGVPVHRPGRAAARDGARAVRRLPGVRRRLRRASAPRSTRTSPRPLTRAAATTPALLDRTEFTQPALFAFEVALFRLLESLGRPPDVLVGHSVGELAAAHVAGVLSLADACTLVAARGRLMQALPEGGAMVADRGRPRTRCAAARRPRTRRVAAVNGPRAVVVSGDAGRGRGAAAHWRERGRKTTRLTVSHAFHSPLMEPMLDGLPRRRASA